MVDLIKGNWYKWNDWIFKFEKVEENQIWVSLAATPYDNYIAIISHTGNFLSFESENLINIELLEDFTDVYRLFPEEKFNTSTYNLDYLIPILQKLKYDNRNTN